MKAITVTAIMPILFLFTVSHSIFAAHFKNNSEKIAVNERYHIHDSQSNASTNYSVTKTNTLNHKIIGDRYHITS